MCKLTSHGFAAYPEGLVGRAGQGTWEMDHRVREAYYNKITVASVPLSAEQGNFLLTSLCESNPEFWS